MSKNIKIKILNIDELTFEIEEDAKAGDLINLGKFEEINFQTLRQDIQKKISDIESESINTYIENNKARLYNDWKQEDKDIEKLLNQKETLQKQKETLEKEKIMSANEIDKIKTQLSEKQSQFNKDLDSVKREFEVKLKEESHEDKIKIEKLKTELDSVEEKIVLRETNKYNSEINQLNTTLEKNKLEEKIRINELENKLKVEYEEIIKRNEEEIDLWKNKRSQQNIKEIGEELESFISNEFSKSMGFLNDVSLEKTTKDIDNTKPDFKFVVYKDETKKEILTSVIIEAKSESLNAKRNTKNSQHFDKLEKDRTKFGGEYSLLISELEKQADDPFILTRANVEGKQYSNMFVTRPQYFITFLMLIYNLSQGKKDIIEEEINFMKSKQILDEFEQMKSQIINESIKKTEEKIKKSISLADEINKKASSIIDNLEKSLGRSNLETVKNKINEFKIKTLVKKIEGIENESI